MQVSLQQDPSTAISWETLPNDVDPFSTTWRSHPPNQSGGQPTVRGERKRAQIQNFYQLLLPLIDTLASRAETESPVTVVDFGSGSGNLVLPLASLFPQCAFVAVDYKEKALALLKIRAEKSGLVNLKVVPPCLIQSYSGPCDVALSLHGCGSATDFVIELALERGVPYLASPCCVGKVNGRGRGRKGATKALLAVRTSTDSNSGKHAVSKPGQVQAQRMVQSFDESFVAVENDVFHEDGQLVRPRSRWLRGQLSMNQYSDIAIAADRSEVTESQEAGFHNLESDFCNSDMSPAAKSRFCKILVELDRNEHAVEVGNYRAFIAQMHSLESYAKKDVLVGLPPGVILGGF